MLCCSFFCLSFREFYFKKKIQGRSSITTQDNNGELHSLGSFIVNLLGKNIYMIMESCVELQNLPIICAKRSFSCVIKHSPVKTHWKCIYKHVSFAQRQGLQQHLTMHSEERPFFVKYVKNHLNKKRLQQHSQIHCFFNLPPKNLLFLRFDLAIFGCVH